MKVKGKVNTFLGKDTTFQGDLTFSGAIRIDGRFQGRITSSGTLIVGREGRLESDVRVGDIIIAGEVRGNIQAERSIEIQVPGRVYGDIQAPTVMIHQGVIFEGGCRTLSPPKSAVSPKLSFLRDRSGKTEIPAGQSTGTDY